MGASLGLVELVDDTIGVIPAYPLGEDGLVGEVEIDKALPQSVPSALLLQVLLRILVQHAFHLLVEGLELLANAADLLLYAVQLLLLFGLALIVAVCGVVEGRVFSPAGALLALFQDAAELWGAQACYYGLIHDYRPLETEQNNIRAVDQLFLATAFSPVATSPFSFTRCYSPSLFGRSTFASFSFSPFFGTEKWLAVTERMAGLQATNLAVSSFLLQLRTVPYFLSMNESQLSLAFEASTVSSTHFLNLRCSAQAVQLSLNQKNCSLFQNSSGVGLKTFLRFSGTASWLAQSYLGSFGWKLVVLRYSQSKNLEKLLSSKENSRLADLQWLRGSRPAPKAWITHFGCSCSLATTVAPCAQILSSISSGSYRRQAVQLVVSRSCLGRSQTLRLRRGSWVRLARTSSYCSALPTFLRQSACSS